MYSYTFLFRLYLAPFQNFHLSKASTKYFNIDFPSLISALSWVFYHWYICFSRICNNPLYHVFTHLMAKYTCDTLKNRRPHNPYHILRDSNWHLYYNSKYFRTQARSCVIMQSLLHHCRAVNMSYSSLQDIVTCKVISAGRPFLCRLIDISYSSHLHHYIRLTTTGLTKTFIGGCNSCQSS